MSAALALHEFAAKAVGLGVGLAEALGLGLALGEAETLGLAEGVGVAVCDGEGVGAAATGEATSTAAVAIERRLAAKPFEEINIISRLRAESFRAELPRRRKARGYAIPIAT